MPSGRSPPPGFGIITRRTGWRRYVFARKLLPEPGQPLLQPRRLDRRERHPVHARRALVGARQVVGVAQDVRAADLVVEQVEAERRLLLRLAIQLPLKRPDLLQVLPGSSPITATSSVFESTPEVRALPSTGITRLRRYYDPLRLPPRPPPCAASRPRPSSSTGLPRYPITLLDVPCPLPRWTEPGASVGCFPVRAAFPESQAGRRPRLHFRGLLRLHSRYGPSDRSTAQGGLCHEASTRPVARPRRPPATGPTDHCPGGTFTHW